MTDPMNTSAVRVLCAALGIGADGRRRGFRNSLVATPGEPEHAICKDLVKVGLMCKLPKDGTVPRGKDAFGVTYDGRVVMKAYQVRSKRPRKTASVLRFFNR